jgi:hypothetical protein
MGLHSDRRTLGERVLIDRVASASATYRVVEAELGDFLVVAVGQGQALPDLAAAGPLSAEELADIVRNRQRELRLNRLPFAVITNKGNLTNHSAAWRSSWPGMTNGDFPQFR